MKNNNFAMSQQSRPTQGTGVPSFVPSGMLPNVRGPVPPFIYNQPARVPYNITTVPATQHFVPSTIVYPSQLADTSGVVPPGMQRFYVPVQQLPIHTFNTVPLGQRKTSADPAMLLEEQRKIEKERNFQMQQQRLKQFTIAGKKGSLNADNLLDSMFGKLESKKQSVKSSLSDQAPQLKGNGIPVTKTIGHHQPPVPTTVPVVRQDDFPPKPREAKTKEKFRKDPKELENMMMKCSNFTGPQRAKLFQKPAVKELPKSSPQGTTFSVSEKSVDWRSIQGLEDIFSAPKPRFPMWCRKESVPPLFLQVQNVVTGNDSHPPETNVLHSIFISSGLPQKTLGEIWEMVNQDSPGSLTNEEMYAALALIAVAQAGHQIKNPDILHRLPACPAPNLQCFNPPESADANAVSVPSQIAAGPKGDQKSDTGQQNMPSNVRPSSIASSTENITNDVSTWTPFATVDDKVQGGDDDFDEFKSHTPMAVNAPTLSEAVGGSCEEEFDEFKQAPCAVPSFASFPKSEETVAPAPVLSKPHVAVSDLMLPEDKYSVFRMLQQDTSATETVALTSSAEDSELKNTRSAGLFGSREDNQEPLLVEEENTDAEEDTRHVINPSADTAEDDFGDFLDASTTPVPSPVMTRSNQQQDIQIAFTEDFADFSQLNNSTAVFNEPDQPKSSLQMPSKLARIDADFGDFATFQKSTLKPDVGLDYFSSCSKDNISLAESQSISSLEFGTFDGIGLGGDSKTSLSRQGSIPSLDLKVPGLEPAETEDDFGDMQSAVAVSKTVSPSPSVDANKSSEEKFQPPPSGLPVPPALNVPLADKYSVIRSEQVFDEDQHISEWTRCIKSSLSVLQNATRIFNQMSCSSVCNEVLGTEEGKNYVKNVIEVYRVVCRVALASKSYEKQNNKLFQLLEDSDRAFNTLTVFLTGSPLLPDESSLDFASAVLRADSDNNEKACGVCLLDVDSCGKACNKMEELTKLTYGRRQYHCTCANLWVNCVDPLLPVLTLPQLI